MSQMVSGIAGAVVGSLMQIGNFYSQKRAQDKQNALAEKQYQASRTAYLNEEQAREGRGQGGRSRRPAFGQHIVQSFADRSHRR